MGAVRTSSLGGFKYLYYTAEYKLKKKKCQYLLLYLLLLCQDAGLYRNNKDDEPFLDEVRLICFAVVVESTDKLYYKEADSNATDSMRKTVSDIGNMLEHRLERYLFGIKCRNNLAKIVLSYYEDGVINKEQLNVEYEMFLKSGDKANYYKSDEEIKRLLPDLRKDMTESTGHPFWWGQQASAAVFCTG